MAIDVVRLTDYHCFPTALIMCHLFFLKAAILVGVVVVVAVLVARHVSHAAVRKHAKANEMRHL